ncbi:uncharacterized protein LOC131193199 [Ahaetulla prasina]|uniref:uncharacterized protein LOC131193199 n=1 Tax=Ahaetulla prasina TaxID=499056 RepID=UPI002647194F|nr:uncharacterized protein LOC131193199 [Ahaetulla prasina]
MAYSNYMWAISGQTRDSHKWPDFRRSGSWSLQRNQKKEVSRIPLLNYQEYLHGFLGSEKASYFLNPPTTEKPISPRVRRLLVAGIDMGAEEVWRALHEEPKYQHEITASSKGHSLSEQVPWLGRPATTRRLRQVASWQQQLRAMHRLGKQHQYAALYLLATDQLPDLNDSYGTEGPTRYFHNTLSKKQVSSPGINPSRTCCYSSGKRKTQFS